MLNLLFVYGTLRSEFDNEGARTLRSQARFLRRATVPGAIYHIRDYPGFRSEPAGEVHGEIYQLPQPAATLAELDDYEGPDFERVVWSGAWIYRYRHTPSEDRRILSGDFCPPGT